MKITKEDLIKLYNEAKKGYESCINNEDNNYLEGEIDIPLEKVKYIEHEIKVRFVQKKIEQYIFEINLTLYAEDKEIGRYLYIVNEKGEYIDEFLIFD